MNEWMIIVGGLSLIAAAIVFARSAVHAIHFEKCQHERKDRSDVGL